MNISGITCLVCNASCVSSRNSFQIFDQETPEQRPIRATLAKLIDQSLDEDQVHSKVLCKKCLKLLDEFDELQLRCNEIKTEISSNYRETVKKREERKFEQNGENSVDNVNSIKSSSLDEFDVNTFKDAMAFPNENTEEEGVVSYDQRDENSASEHISDDEYQLVEQSDDSDEENVPVSRIKQEPSDNNDKPNILKRRVHRENSNSDELIKQEFEYSPPIVSYKDDIYSCLLCSKSKFCVREPQTIIVHMKEEHNVRLYVCDICGENFRKRNELSAHLDEHINNDEDDFQCDVCNRIFNSLRLFRIHKRMHYPNHKAWICETCGKKYTSKNLLDEHVNTHSGLRPYVCRLCGKDFASKYTFKAHEKIHGIRPRPFCCSKCPKSFLTQQNLSQHEKTHLGIKDFRCHLCGKEFGTAHNLETHSIVHTGFKPYACESCGKSFARKAEIRDHERIHTGERPFQCEMCGSTFSQRSNLQSHKRATHFDDKRHKCDFCFKAFKRRRLLDYHLKAAHTGERPFKCGVCDATFVYPEHFKKHRRIHTGEKPFSCEVCGKAFNSRDNRNAHRFIHSDKKPYECLVCGAGFMRKPLLYQHMQSQGHMNDTIVVNQPRLMVEDDQLVTVNADGDVEIIEATMDEKKLDDGEEITEQQMEMVDDDQAQAIEHIIIDGQHLNFTGSLDENGEFLTADYEELASGQLLHTAETQIVETTEGPMQLVRVRIPDENGGEQEAWVKIVPDD